jgi:parallel beta-helix repeat protein
MNCCTPRHRDWASLYLAVLLSALCLLASCLYFPQRGPDGKVHLSPPAGADLASWLAFRVPSQGPTEVRLGPGAWRLTKSIVLLGVEDLTITGQGPSTRLIVADKHMDAVLLLKGARRVTIQDVTFEGLAANKGDKGIRLERCQKVSIKGCRFQGLQTAIYFIAGEAGGPPGNHLVKNNLITDSKDFGILLWNSQDSIIKGNKINGALGLKYPAHCIYLKDSCRRILVQDNLCTGSVNGAAIVIHSGHQPHNQARDNRIIGNTCRDSKVGITISAGVGAWLKNNLIVGCKTGILLRDKESGTRLEGNRVLK